MAKVVLIDRGDHWEVIGDYSRSPRIGIMTEAQWQECFDGSEFETMKESQPGAVAAEAPNGTGKWLKDWSGKYVPEIMSVLSNAIPDFDGIPAVQAGKTEFHIITVSHPDPKQVPLRIISSAPVPISDSMPMMDGGSASFTVGPCDYPCDVTISSVDPTGNIKKKSLLVRFK